MKLIVFGATGGIGSRIVEQALAKGHEVTAFARTPSKLDVDHKRLSPFQGNVLDPISVELAVRRHDGVLVALGAPPRDKSDIRSKGTKNIITAMEKAGPRRLVCLSTLGMGESWQQIPLLYKFLFSTFLKRAFKDHKKQEDYIRKSGLEWIIARPGAFTDDGKTGRYRHGFAVTDRTIKGKISRVDVADFMLNQLEDDTYLYKAPGISY